VKIKLKFYHFYSVFFSLLGLVLFVIHPEQSLAKSVDTGHFSVPKLTPGETGRIRYIIDGDNFIMDSPVSDGGLKVILAGIQAPKTAWPEKNITAWPLAQEARDYLRTLCKDKTAMLYYGGDKRDRYDRALAQVWLMDARGEKGVWLQEAMVEAGYARVYTWPKSLQDTARLYAAEARARAKGLGIWDEEQAGGFYTIRKPDPDPLAQYVDSLQIVEGIIISSVDIRGTVYLNFGSNHRTDFTVAISKKSRRLFKKIKLDLYALQGARVRVRGWIEISNGPVMWLGDPNRIEVLD